MRIDAPSSTELRRMAAEDGLRLDDPGVLGRLRRAWQRWRFLRAARRRPQRPVRPAADHPLRGEPDGSHADWWLEAVRDDWHDVGSFIPPVFDAVVVVLHPYSGDDGSMTWQQVADEWGVARSELRRSQPWMEEVPPGPGSTQAWRSVEGAPGGPQEELPREVAEALLPHLAAATDTPEDVFVGRWIGFGGEDVVERFAPCAVVPTRDRGHALLRGPLDGVMTGLHPDWRADVQVVGGIWWPADRAWAVHTEVDGPTTEVAGSRALIDALLAAADLEVIEVGYDDRLADWS